METSIGQCVTEYMDRTGDTLDSVAERLGMGRDSLAERLSGRVEFTLREAFDLSRILGCTVDELACCAVRGA